MERHIAVICNPLSGKGKPLQLLPRFEHYLQSKQLRYTSFIKDLPPTLDSFTDLVILGGDGTLNYTLNHFRDIGIPIGYISCGTGNDIGKLLLGGQSYEQQFETAVFAPAKNTDCGACNDRLFLNGAGIGFDGRVAKKLLAKSLLKGKAAYYTTVITLLLFYKESEVSITAGNVTWKAPLFMLNAANGKTYGGGFNVAPKADISDGLLELITVGEISLFQRMKYLPVIEKGKHLDQPLPFIDYRQCGKVIIESPAPLDAHLDGEYLSAARFEIEILPGKLLLRY
jgi:diacylglycerol kinase (ATP)